MFENPACISIICKFLAARQFPSALTPKITKANVKQGDPIFTSFIAHNDHDIQF